MTVPDRPDDRGPTPGANGAVRAEFDWTAVAPSTAVVETVAVASNREPTALEPLYGSVDPDALDALVGSDGGAEADITVSFTFADYDVTVHGDGAVVVRPVT